ncbi:MAG: choice-of-anchor D domain-containing protein [Acidobacteriota bacterium]
MSNLGPGALKVTAITSSSPQFSVLSPARPFQVAPGAEQAVSVRFQPASAGSFPATLTIANDDPDRPTATVAVRGAAAAPPRPQMRIEPASLDFGAVAVGQSKDLAFTIRNTGGVTLTVSAITSGNPRFTVVSPAPPFDVTAGAVVTVTLRFAPAAAGAQNGSLAIAGNDPNLATATLALSGNGVVTPVTQNPAPTIGSLSPASITAGGPAFTFTLNGSNFVSASVVEWNGVSRPTVVVSATQLTASIGTADIAAPGIASVTVSNPAPGGGRSNALTFVITQAAAAAPSVMINQIDIGGCPLINGYVSVLDRSGSYIVGLSGANLACTEDGQPVRCSVEPGASIDQPLSVALIIGTSPVSTATELDLLKSAVREFVTQLGQNDRAAIHQLDREAQAVSGFTSSKPGLFAVIDSLQPVGGGTALYDAVLQGINLASQQQGRRQAVVVLASGENTSGTVRDANRVISAAGSAGVPVFSFAFGAGAGNGNLENFLRQLAAETVGQFDSQPAAMTMLLPMQRLGQTLANQYVVSYSTPRKDGQTHTLGIRFTGSQGTASTTRPYSRCGP